MIGGGGDYSQNIFAKSAEDDFVKRGEFGRFESNGVEESFYFVRCDN
jgi:hypothetical protein